MSKLIKNQCRRVRYVGLLFVFLFGMFSSLWAQTFQKLGLTYKVIPDARAQVEIVECDSSLKHLFIPDSVTYCGKKYCVALCGGYPDSLEYITVADNNQFLSSLDGVLFNKERTELLRYPRGLKNSSYVVPASVRKICNHAFCLASVKSVKLSPSVKEIDNLAFSRCSSLKEIRVARRNPFYSSEDGVLFSKDKTILYRYPAAKADTAYYIPSTVKTLVPFAFENALSLLRIRLPENLYYMEKSIFKGCRSLRTLEIPKNVSTIYRSFFSDSPLLKSVVFSEGVEYMPRHSYQLKYFFDLETVSFPATLTDFSDYFWENMNHLREIRVAADNPKYTAVDGVLFNKKQTLLIKYPCNKPDSVYIVPPTVKIIAKNAFECAFNLKHLVLPDSLEIADASTFYSIPLSTLFAPKAFHLMGFRKDFVALFKLKTLKMGKKMDVTEMFLDWGPELIRYEVSEENPDYSSEDGVLFNKDKTCLIRYPAGRKDSVYVVPSTVKEIDPDAFYGANNLTTLILPDGLKTIDQNLLYVCPSIKKLRLPPYVEITNARQLYIIQ